MGMAIDWNEAAADLKRDVDKHGGFLTMQRDKFKERFGLGKLAKKNSEDLLTMLDEYGMIVLPHPYYVQGTFFRIYDVESEIGKIALAVWNPQDVPETALVDVVNQHERATAGKHRRSDCVPWLSALDVFLQVVIRRPPEDWEDLDDDREPYQLVEALAAGLELPTDIVHARETSRMAGAVCTYRPRGFRWESVLPALGTTLAEAARKQKDIFDAVLLATAKHLLGGAEIPSREVDLGKLRLRYRREA